MKLPNQTNVDAQGSLKIRYSKPSSAFMNNGGIKYRLNKRNDNSLKTLNMLPTNLKDTETYLHEMLKSHSYEEAGDIIKLSSVLSSKYELSDVLKLMIQKKQMDLAGKLIRKYELANDKQLVTFFIRELLHNEQFSIAISYAEEFVFDFKKVALQQSNASNTNMELTWTPQTMIQAMIRSRQYKAAIKYSLKYKLDSIFPVNLLVSLMIQSKQWVEAFEQIKEQKLEDEFPSHLLINKMIEEKMLDNAISFIQMDSNLKAKYPMEQLILMMIKRHWFLPALQYLKKAPEVSYNLLREILHQLVIAKEFYKAIKYTVKFKLTAEEPFTLKTLLMKAIEARQYAVAELYIRKHHLENEFKEQLEFIKIEKKQLARDFHLMMNKKIVKYNSQEQKLLRQKVYGIQEDDYEITEVTEDIVLESHEERIPRKTFTEDVEEKIVLQQPIFITKSKQEDHSIKKEPSGSIPLYLNSDSLTSQPLHSSYLKQPKFYYVEDIENEIIGLHLPNSIN